MTSAIMRHRTALRRPAAALFAPLQLAPGVQKMVRAAQPSVMIAAIIGITVIILGIMASAVILALQDKDGMAIITLLGAVVTPWVVAVFGRVVNYLSGPMKEE